MLVFTTERSKLHRKIQHTAPPPIPLSPRPSLQQTMASSQPDSGRAPHSPEPELAQHQTLNLQLLRTETRATLQELGVSETSPRIDPNYPVLNRPKNPVFPEEYTLEK